jgi:predicted solute-binding protein
VDSVILVATSNIGNLEKVYLDPRSKSANLLYKVIQENFIKKKIKYDYLTPDLTNIYEMNTGQVIIGDLALKFLSQRPIGIKIYDLSELWFKETSLPFTFATFNYYLDKPKPFELELLDNSFKSGMTNIDNILKDFANRYKSEVDLRLIETYLKERIIYKLTEKHLDGVNLFYQLSGKFAKWKKRSFNNIL